jgi:hypothetical protein
MHCRSTLRANVLFAARPIVKKGLALAKCGCKLFVFKQKRNIDSKTFKDFAVDKSFFRCGGISEDRIINGANYG